MKYIDIRGCAKEYARNTKRVLVCGSRDFNKDSYSEAQVHAKLDELRAGYFKDSNVVIINGWANGADMAGATWAESRNLPFLTIPAEWDKHGKIAGFFRNELMIALGQPDVVVAFPGGAGTKDMISRTTEHGIELIEIEF